MRDCELAIASARTRNITSLSIYVDILGSNNDKFLWLSNFMRSGTRRKCFFEAFGFEDDGQYTGKKRRVKIDHQELRRSPTTNTSSMFDLFPIWHLPGGVATTTVGTKTSLCC